MHTSLPFSANFTVSTTAVRTLFDIAVGTQFCVAVAGAFTSYGGAIITEIMFATGAFEIIIYAWYFTTPVAQTTISISSFFFS